MSIVAKLARGTRNGLYTMASAGLCKGDTSRMYGFNITVPSKVPVVERQNMLDAMRSHCRHQARRELERQRRYV